MPRISERLLDWAVVASGALILVGLALVGRAASQGELSSTLFSVWHAPLYLGVLLAAYVLMASVPAQAGRGLTGFLRGLPEHYRVSGLGLILFLVGFVGDVPWQALAGDSTGPEALITPPHLTAFVGIALILLGPVRSRVAGAGPAGGRLPTAVALGLLIGLAGFVTGFANPIVSPLEADPFAHPLLEGATEVWTMSADGSRQTRLTNQAQGVATDPSWAADGASEIHAVWHYVDGRDPSKPDGVTSSIVVTSTSGQQEFVTLDGAWVTTPIYSPDQTLVALDVFAATASSAPPAGNLPRSDETPRPQPNLRPDDANGLAPHGSSQEGRDWEVAVVDNRPHASPRFLTRLASLDVMSGWSADGSSVLVHSDRSGNFEIYRVDVKTGVATALTNDPAGDTWASAAPDGKTIAFSSDRGGRTHLWLMNSDGTNPQQLTFGDWDDWLAAWSPDGSQLIFLTNRDANTEIYRMAADGSDATNLTRSPTLDEWFTSGAWSRDGTIIYAANRQPAQNNLALPLGIIGFIAWSVIITAFLLFVLRLGGLPIGGMAIALAIAVALLATSSGLYVLVVAAAVAGLVADLLVWRLRPIHASWRELAVAAALPSAFTTAYLGILIVSGDNHWPWPLMISLVWMSAAVGLCTAILAIGHAGNGLPAARSTAETD